MPLRLPSIGKLRDRPARPAAQMEGRNQIVTTQPYFEFKSSPLSEAAVSWRGEQEGTQKFFTDPFYEWRSNG
jgi:hypothetical protein